LPAQLGQLVLRLGRQLIHFTGQKSHIACAVRIDAGIPFTHRHFGRRRGEVARWANPLAMQNDGEQADHRHRCAQAAGSHCP